eukprot:c9899_g1_i3.p1 GENE.c9899_g1_i3~~c9899_g1_i3.p1  ORF type:complete len:566 (-),score=106.00 c9899_g1_i3:161-1858(-)
MIYDEGWELRIGHRSFFGFSMFVPKPHMANLFNPYGGGSEESSTENYQSVCHETIDGWYHFDNGSDWGCYYATKTTHSSQGSTVSPMDILGPTGPNADFSEFLELDTTTEQFMGAGRHRVKQINNSPHLEWSGRNYPEFEQYSFLELGLMLGTTGQNRKQVLVSAVPDSRADHIKYGDLPESLDWRNFNGQNYLPSPRKQGSCGSCYAIAATQMVEARIRIKTNNTLQVKLSPQSILSCSVYSQGCDGGFPFLVGKYGQDYGFLEESCLPYQPKKALCSWRCSNPKVWYTNSYHYIGGSYGKCSEVAMMTEIRDKGPIIVGFNAPQDLFWYSEGIFHEDQDVVPLLQDQTSQRPKHQKAFFEKTNHAVLAVGWGKDPQTNRKYWIVQNTWGDDWGDQGYFKIYRGEDMCSFEAMSVAFDPIIPEDLEPSQYNHHQEAAAPASSATMPEPEVSSLAQRVQVDGKAQVIAGASSGFKVSNEEDDTESELIQQPTSQNVALQLDEDSTSQLPQTLSHDRPQPQPLKPRATLLEQTKSKVSHDQSPHHHHHHHTRHHNKQKRHDHDHHH